MCDIITSIYQKDSCMGILKGYVFNNRLLTGLGSCLESVDSHRLDLLYILSHVFYSSTAYSFSQEQAELIHHLSQNMEIMYENEKESGLFSPSFQCILETLVSVELMCYDNERDTMNNVTSLRGYMSQKPFFKNICKTAIVLSALSHRSTRALPQHLLLKDYLIDILIQLKESKLYETEHPYNDVLRFVSTNFDNAISLMVRFEGTPSSEEDDVFALYICTLLCFIS